jgi:acetyl esterase/lipase
MCRKGLLLFTLLAACSWSTKARSANAPEAIALWAKGAPGEKGDVDEEKVLPNKSGDTITRVTNVTKPTIAIYRPPADKDTGTAVVICPGGGYSILAMNLEGTEVAEWLNTLGVTGIVLKYRVPVRKGQERYAAPLQDAQRALGLVRHRAKEWGLNPERIGVLGFSAGGHLAATLSTNYDKRTYELVDEADKTSCRPDFTLLIYPAYLVVPTGTPQEKDKGPLAPELRITAQTPRTFLVYTEDDRVENGLFYYLALKNAKVPAEMHLYPSGGHGYGLRPSKHVVSTWPQRAEQWLRSFEVVEQKK